MPGSSYVYASGRVSGLDNFLLTHRVWSQLLSAEDADDVLRILADSWYGDLLQTEGSLDKALRMAAFRAEEELVELSPDATLTAGVLLRRDVRNARYLWKNMLFDGDGGIEVEPMGMIAVDMITTAWTDEDAADSLPEQFRFALNELKELHSPFAAEADAVMDRLAAKTETEYLGKLKEPVGALPTIRIELKNFLAAARNRDEEHSVATLGRTLLPGGYHTPEEISEAARMNRLPSLLEETSGFEKTAKALEEGLDSGSFLTFQRESDRFVLEILNRASGDMSSPGPLAAYVLHRELEVSHIRILAAGKAAGIDSRRLSARIPRG